MGLPQPVKRYTPEEYYTLERVATYKSDYYDGEIFAMAGGTSRHSLIVMNVGGELRQRLKGNPCTPYESNQRVAIQATGLRVYPDVSVYCEALKYDDQDSRLETAINPTLVIEVLSPSTEAYDRGLKFDNYRQIPSLRGYVLVSQEVPHVETFERRPDGSWLMREDRKLDGSVELPGLNLSLPLAEIYDRVEFPASQRPPRPQAEL